MLLQPWKARAAILRDAEFSSPKNSISVILEQLLNAASPIFVTHPGITSLVMFLQPYQPVLLVVIA